MEKRNVILTGFGPFGVHSVNNSWECAKLLKATDLEQRKNINLIIHEIPVMYDTVDNIVPAMWEQYDPILMVHVGVHQGDTIIVEKCAHGHGYVRKDVKECLPTDGKCQLGSEEVIYTKLDVGNIAESSSVLPSTNAGRYLCEYTYYLSLSRDSTRTLFVHIPPCDSCVSKDYIVNQLSSIIEICLDQLSSVTSEIVVTI